MVIAMTIVNVGVSHRFAPAETLEKLAVPLAELGEVLSRLHAVPSVDEVAILCTWGPRTGTGQVPLARLPFGKAIFLPGTVQWLSSIAWDALVGLFGGEAAQLLLGVPFWAGAAIVLALEGLVSIYGYEFVHRLQSWGSAILIVLFAVLTARIFQHHVVLPHNTVHGGALIGATSFDQSLSLLSISPSFASSTG